jgi:hypothetical protein
MNAVVVDLDKFSRQKLHQLVEFCMVGEREVIIAAIDEYHHNHIILPRKKDPYQSDEDVLNEG